MQRIGTGDCTAPSVYIPEFPTVDHAAKHGFEVPVAIRSMNRMPANVGTEPLAEWCRRTPGGDLPPRVARPCDRTERAAPETSGLRIRVVLLRTVRILDRGRERWGGELAARSLVVFLPSIDSKGCITAMIELPRGRSSSARPYIRVWDR